MKRTTTLTILHLRNSERRFGEELGGGGCRWLLAQEVSKCLRRGSVRQPPSAARRAGPHDRARRARGRRLPIGFWMPASFGAEVNQALKLLA
jgi:hypothetical protein